MSKFNPNAFQDTNFPDFDLERDLLLEEEELLGIATAELAAERSFRINIATIIISALIFLVILAWFDFIQTAFYAWTFPASIEQTIPADVKLWYALVITIVIIILVYLILYHSKSLKL